MLILTDEQWQVIEKKLDDKDCRRKTFKIYSLGNEGNAGMKKELIEVLGKLKLEQDDDDNDDDDD